ARLSLCGPGAPAGPLARAPHAAFVDPGPADPADARGHALPGLAAAEPLGLCAAPRWNRGLGAWRLDPLLQISSGIGYAGGRVLFLCRPDFRRVPLAAHAALDKPGPAPHEDADGHALPRPAPA